MARQSVRIEVENLRELQRGLRKIDKGLGSELRKVNKRAAEPIADEAAKRAPKGPTGRLAKSVGVKASQRSAAIKAGSASRVPYAGPVHWGWKNRPQGGFNPATPFLKDAVADKIDEARDVYEVDIRDFMKLIESR